MAIPLKSSHALLPAIYPLSHPQPRILRVILKYAGTMAPMAPILLVVDEAKAELAQALVQWETGAMCK